MQNANVQENKLSIFQCFEHTYVKTINFMRTRLFRTGKWVILCYFERKTRIIIYISHIHILLHTLHLPIQYSNFEYNLNNSIQVFLLWVIRVSLFIFITINCSKDRLLLFSFILTPFSQHTRTYIIFYMHTHFQDRSNIAYEHTYTCIIFYLRVYPHVFESIILFK